MCLSRGRRAFTDTDAEDVDDRARRARARTLLVHGSANANPWRLRIVRTSCYILSTGILRSMRSLAALDLTELRRSSLRFDRRRLLLLIG